MTARPKRLTDPASVADAIIGTVDKNVVLAAPLGLGKANHIVNALYDQACDDRSISLQIYTALTLEKHRPRAELARRFADPLIERLFGGYPDLRYVGALRGGSLPPNIRVYEFFFLAGSWLDVPRAQQSYISANYSHATNVLLGHGVNVVAQLVAPSDNDAMRGHYSLSCNPDLTLELLDARRSGRIDCVLAGQVNNELPFMGSDAAVPEAEFDFILESADCQFPLFAPPKEPVLRPDAAIGLHVARMVRDGGTLQIGIGSIGDAVAQALILRHRQLAAFRTIVGQLVKGEAPAVACEDGPFQTGLYGASEMLVDGFLHLIRAGILKREVDGALIHAAFFIDHKGFYRALREMPVAERDRIRMTAVSYVNELYRDEDVKRRARVDARFVNNAMMATLLGAVISDGLQDGRVVSGVGGQYNFVSQAFALDGARSIITVNATRSAAGGTTVSNIVWSYGHATIPRHLRDIVVTEYGVADLRGLSDAETIAAMLAVTDSRFQDELLRRAKDAGKIAANYEIPAAHRENYPERIARVLGPAEDTAILKMFPFGTDFTPTEQRLLPALTKLKYASASRRQMARLALCGHIAGPPDEATTECLERMGLRHPTGLKERLYRAILHAALDETRKSFGVRPVPPGPG